MIKYNKKRLSDFFPCGFNDLCNNITVTFTEKSF